MRALTVRSPGANSRHQTPAATTTPASGSVEILGENALARRVAAKLARWGVAADSSAGLSLSGCPGGVLAGHEGATTPAVTADKATQITPAQVRDVVTTARTADEPGVFDRVSDFYSQHPDLVKTLGAGALMIALARMKQNLGR